MRLALSSSRPGTSHRSKSTSVRLGVTYAYFRDIVLGGTREYKMGSIDQSGSKDVVALVSRTPCAIGYSGIAFATAGVKTLKLTPRNGEPAVTPSVETVIEKWARIRTGPQWQQPCCGLSCGR